MKCINCIYCGVVKSVNVDVEPSYICSVDSIDVNPELDIGCESFIPRMTAAEFEEIKRLND